MRQAIIIFTRIPKAGETKTRMMPYLTPEECAQLHNCLLQDVSKVVKECEQDIFVFFTSEPSGEALEEFFGSNAKYYVQEGVDLGQRMLRAIEIVIGQGYESCVLMGTDVPEISKKDIEEAFSILEKKDVVLNPTEDGGYYLIGMKKPIGEAFQVTSYGQSSVYEETIKQLEDNGYQVGCGQNHQDMDTKEDLQDLARRARKSKALRQTKTGRFALEKSKLSIIIPIYNEKRTILEIQKQLDKFGDACEILFVDGGSTDGTLDRIDSKYRVLSGVKGRANQMNYGARESSGDILFFLHCDSILPEYPLEEIYEVMQKYSLGCFGVTFPMTNFFMLTNRVISNHRAKCRRIIFGDQGMFLDRKLFFDAGMFPALPIMEDYQLSLTLKAMVDKVGMTKHRIHTSDRRYPKGTIPKLRVMWKMFSLRKRYRAGESIEQIAAEYRDIR